MRIEERVKEKLYDVEEMLGERQELEIFREKVVLDRANSIN